MWEKGDKEKKINEGNSISSSHLMNIARDSLKDVMV